MQKPKSVSREDWAKLEDLLSYVFGNTNGSRTLKEDWYKEENVWLDNTPKFMVDSGRIEEVVEFLEMYKEKK